MTDNLLHGTVSVRGVVFNPRGRCVILKRASDAEWELPGGRLAPDEAPRAGLRRELTEETALSVEVDDIVAANSWINDDNTDRLAIHYRCNTATEPVDLSAEHTDYRWVSPGATASVLCESQVEAVAAATKPTAQMSGASHCTCGAGDCPLHAES